MSEFKGTLGKWTKTVDKKNNIIVHSEKKIREGLYVMQVELGYIYSDDCHIPTCCKTEEHANAQLISAAPDLLEALQEIIPFAKEFINDKHPAMKRAKKAIEKALNINSTN